MSERYEFQGSDSELSAMTRTLDEMHAEAMPKVRQGVAEFVDQVRGGQKKPVSRRLFLMGGLTTAGGVALAACSSTSKKSSAASAPAASASAGASAGLTGDLKVVGLAAALENLAVAAYGLALKNAGAGKYGSVPPAVGTFATVAMKQHADHSAAWNAVLSASGKAQVTGYPLTFAGQAVDALNSAKDIGTVATAALGLENTAAQTYLFAEANVSAPQGISTAATIAPVEAMHVAILYYVLGKYPVPDAFLGTSNAVPLTAFTG